jgi:hypothetical protein
MDFKHFQFKCPFTCVIAGPTSSGKSVLTRRILKNYDVLFNFKNPVLNLKVLWCYGIWQPLYNQQISNNVYVKYVEGLPSKDEIFLDKPNIIIIDDLMTQLGNNPALADLFTKGSHHNDISVIFITQNLFHKGREMRNISLNSHYYIIMKSPRDKAQINTFARELFPGKTKFFLEAYEDATKEGYSYIKVDLTQTTPDNLRVRTRITPEEVEHLNLKFSPIIYNPK